MKIRTLYCNLSQRHTTGHFLIKHSAVSVRPANVQARNRFKTGGNCLGLHPTTPPAFHTCPVV